MNELQTTLNAILSQKTTYIVPENIVSGVTVLGVTGTMSGITQEMITTAHQILGDAE